MKKILRDLEIDLAQKKVDFFLGGRESTSLLFTRIPGDPHPTTPPLEFLKYLNTVKGKVFSLILTGAF